jgi:hypothetical protein
MRLDVCSSAAVGSNDMVTKRSVESRSVDTRNSSAFSRLALNWGNVQMDPYMRI